MQIVYVYNEQCIKYCCTRNYMTKKNLPFAFELRIKCQTLQIYSKAIEQKLMNHLTSFFIDSIRLILKQNNLLIWWHFIVYTDGQWYQIKCKLICKELIIKIICKCSARMNMTDKWKKKDTKQCDSIENVANTSKCWPTNALRLLTFMFSTWNSVSHKLYWI